MLKFVSYFTVFCELSRRVGGGIFESTKFFKPQAGGGVWEGTGVNVKTHFNSCEGVRIIVNWKQINLGWNSVLEKWIEFFISVWNVIDFNSSYIWKSKFGRTKICKKRFLFYITHIDIKVEVRNVWNLKQIIMKLIVIYIVFLMHDWIYKIKKINNYKNIFIASN